MRYNPEHKAKTREAVLHEAARALRMEGPAGIGVAAIMARAGLTHGGFYAHFPSRDALVTEAIAEAFSDGAALFAAAPPEPDPRKALAALIRSYVSRAHRDARATGCPLPALAGDMSRAADGARESFGAGVTRLTRRMEHLLRAIGAANAASLAQSVLSEMVGSIALARAITDDAQSLTILRASRNNLIDRLGLEPAPSKM